jgi:hypothetical protein
LPGASAVLVIKQFPLMRVNNTPQTKNHSVIGILRWRGLRQATKSFLESVGQGNPDLRPAVIRRQCKTFAQKRKALSRFSRKIRNCAGSSAPPYVRQKRACGKKRSANEVSAPSITNNNYPITINKAFVGKLKTKLCY